MTIKELNMIIFIYDWKASLEEHYECILFGDWKKFRDSKNETQLYSPSIYQLINDSYIDLDIKKIEQIHNLKLSKKKMKSLLNLLKNKSLYDLVMEKYNRLKHIKNGIRYSNEFEKLTKSLYPYNQLKEHDTLSISELERMAKDYNDFNQLTYDKLKEEIYIETKIEISGETYFNMINNIENSINTGSSLNNIDYTYMAMKEHLQSIVFNDFDRLYHSIDNKGFLIFIKELSNKVDEINIKELRELMYSE